MIDKRYSPRDATALVTGPANHEDPCNELGCLLLLAASGRCSLWQYCPEQNTMVEAAEAVHLESVGEGAVLWRRLGGTCAHRHERGAQKFCTVCAKYWTVADETGEPAIDDKSMHTIDAFMSVPWFLWQCFSPTGDGCWLRGT